MKSKTRKRKNENNRQIPLFVKATGNFKIFADLPFSFWNLQFLLELFILVESSDDEKIVEYKWQELKGPLTEKNKIIKSGVDSPVLQLKSLLPGVYTYKLVNIITY